jgi:hypothetical protein
MGDALMKMKEPHEIPDETKETIDFLVFSKTKPGDIVCADSSVVRKYIQSEHPQVRIIGDLSKTEAHSMHRGPLLGTLQDLFIVAHATHVTS